VTSTNATYDKHIHIHIHDVYVLPHICLSAFLQPSRIRSRTHTHKSTHTRIYNSVCVRTIGGVRLADPAGEALVALAMAATEEKHFSANDNRGSGSLYIHTYIHTHIHTYTHTYIHTYVHTHIHTYTHTYIHTYIVHSNIHTHIHTYKQTK
jgi:hypothetical protein